MLDMPYYGKKTFPTVFPTCVIAIVCYTVQNITYPTVGQMLDMPYYRKKTFPTVFPTCVIASMLHCKKHHLSYSGADVVHAILWEEDLSYSISHMCDSYYVTLYKTSPILQWGRCCTCHTIGRRPFLQYFPHV